MIEHPYFLLLFVLFLVYFYFRKSLKFYIRHAYLSGIQECKSKVVFSWHYFLLGGAFLLILGACNFVWKTTDNLKCYLVHKYVLVNDGSGSMVNNSKENGIGNELTAVLSGNDKLFDFLGKRDDGSKDLVGAVVFSDDAYIVSGLSDDPYFVQKKLKRIDYRVSPMAQGTDIESGLWAGLEILLSHNDVVNQDELNYLQSKFYGAENRIKLDDTLSAIIARKDKLVGGSIIIFTDGIFNAVGAKNKMSSFKIIDFCKLVGVRVYFISIFSLDKNLIKYCKESGGRGDVINGYDKKRLEEIYNEIASSQVNEYYIKEEVVDKSLGTYFGLIGLMFVLIGLFLHNTTQRNLTEV